jgi:hypothetical protein
MLTKFFRMLRTIWGLLLVSGRFKQIVYQFEENWIVGKVKMVKIVFIEYRNGKFLNKSVFLIK